MIRPWMSENFKIQASKGADQSETRSGYHRKRTKTNKIAFI